MKKSVIAVSVIVAMGAAWVGASWYTGKLIEQRITHVVALGNSQLQTQLPNAVVKLSVENYQRGIFSSQVRYVLRSTASNSDDALLKNDQEIALIESIDHGPLPLSELKQFHLIPSLAWAHTELENTSVVNKLFEITKGKSLFGAETRILFNGSSSTAINFIPLDYTDGRSTVKFDGATLHADIDRHINALKLNGDSGSLDISQRNAKGQIEQLTIKKMAVNLDSNKGQLDLNLGKHDLAMNDVAINIDGKESLFVQDINMASQVDESGNNINVQLNYLLNNLKIQGNELGSLGLLIKLKNLDGQGVKEFGEQYGKNSSQISTIALLNNLPLLLKGNPSISIEPLSWKNTKGESTLAMNVDLVASPNETMMPALYELGQAINKIDVNLNVPMPMLTEVMTQLAKLRNHDAVQAEAEAKKQANQLAKIGLGSGFTVMKDDVLSTGIQYANGKITLNGEESSLSDLKSRLNKAQMIYFRSMLE